MPLLDFSLKHKKSNVPFPIEIQQNYFTLRFIKSCIIEYTEKFIQAFFCTMKAELTFLLRVLEVASECHHSEIK